MSGFLNPESYVEGGLFLDDVVAVMRNVKWVLYDYQGQRDPAVCLQVEFETEDGESRTEYYRVGTPDAFEPSDDGMYIEPIGDRKQINKSCKAAIFLGHLVGEAGFDGETLDTEPISCISNMKVHIIQIDPPKSWGSLKDNDGNERKPTIAVVDEILEEDVPEGKKVSKAKGKSKPTAKKAAKKTAKKGKAVELDLDAEAEEAVTTAITEAEDAILLVTDIAAVLASQLKDHPHAKNIISHAFKERFYSSEDRPWVYDPDEGQLYFEESD